MIAREIVSDVYQISLGFVNAFLIDAGELTLIDAGVPGSGEKILRAVQELGKQPADLKRILLTHCHFDHSGSLAMLKEATGARAAMHPADADLLRHGQMRRPVTAAPVWWSRLIFSLVSADKLRRECPPVEIEEDLVDGDLLDIGDQLQAVHVPGHTAGQLAFLWPRNGGVLFAADVCVNMLGMGYAPIYEDVEEGHRSLARLAAMSFEVACFGHGRAIVGGAAARFRQRWLGGGR